MFAVRRSKMSGRSRNDDILEARGQGGGDSPPGGLGLMASAILNRAIVLDNIIALDKTKNGACRRAGTTST